ncbi:ParB/RepB/Spo0J family partition protein [Leptospira bandrabouensis]|uniref:ParB/RepB/Spo0J family partition protein n=1 Tax=Leptospira bandrabouensis TaxID=2484903 RepID=UPI001EE8A9DE|nr:ParB/RepB/Spo0J family partition protein [Leptospira bandrabouensis]MCG6146500.1 ParB/RepB/Spo0J family partition protein [Leptospira bandrabouensis]MCG6161872.1 ParB/RepB/Spo0J family partition protein [Leptospira bandrabouensis]MCG6166077.1 ParB/RepB/Spo0J family partition protein [Leptospira bandrabouensis]
MAKQLKKIYSDSEFKSAMSHFEDIQQYLSLPIQDIDLNLSKNIRDDYDETLLEELANSILENGQLEPVGISPNRNRNGKFYLIYGYRRCLAIKKYAPQIPVKAVTVVSKTDDDTIQLLENIQREDLTDYEIAKALITIKEKSNLRNEDIAKKIHKSLDWVKKRIIHGKSVNQLEEQSQVNPETLRKLTTHQISQISSLNLKEKIAVLNTAEKFEKAKVKDFKKLAKKKKLPKQSTKEMKKNLNAEKAQLESLVRNANARIKQIDKQLAKLT